MRRHYNKISMSSADYCFGERKFGGNAQVRPRHNANRSAAQSSCCPVLQSAIPRDKAFRAAEVVLSSALQAITRGRWLHHTTFLWDFDDAHMALLRHPDRAPAYREVTTRLLLLPTLAPIQQL